MKDTLAEGYRELYRKYIALGSALMDWPELEDEVKARAKEIMDDPKMMAPVERSAGFHLAHWGVEYVNQSEGVQ